MLYVVCARSVWIEVLDDEIFVNLAGFSCFITAWCFRDRAHLYGNAPLVLHGQQVYVIGFSGKLSTTHKK